MSDFLFIEARLPQKTGLELSARLLAARPWWDVEVTGDVVEFYIDLVPGRVDEDLAALEEVLSHFERGRNVEIGDFWISRKTCGPNYPMPGAAGLWRLVTAVEGEEPPPPRPDRIVLPAWAKLSARFWSGESLALSLIAEHLTPPPGAPETRGRPALVMGHTLPLAPLAAVLAGASEAVLISDEKGRAAAVEIAALNGKAAALKVIEEPYKAAAKKREDWAGRFDLIVAHLSPYLASRRFKTLANWLNEGGVVAVSGFAPGPQTAHLLRAAAKAGLSLCGSITEGEWAAMKLSAAEVREELPPLTGNMVPPLVDLPPQEAGFEGGGREDGTVTQAQDATSLLPPLDQGEPIPDEDSLMVDDEDDPDEE